MSEPKLTVLKGWKQISTSPQRFWQVQPVCRVSHHQRTASPRADSPGLHIHSGFSSEDAMVSTDRGIRCGWAVLHLLDVQRSFRRRRAAIGGIVMHRLFSVMCLLAGLSLALAPPGEAAQPNLQGTWTATKAESDGK